MAHKQHIPGAVLALAALLLITPACRRQDQDPRGQRQTGRAETSRPEADLERTSPPVTAQQRTGQEPPPAQQGRPVEASAPRVARNGQDLQARGQAQAESQEARREQENEARQRELEQARRQQAQQETRPGAAGEVRTAAAEADLFAPLQVERQAPRQVRVGEPHEYRIVIHNTSGSAVHGVVLRESVPEHYEVLAPERARAPAVEAAAPRGEADARARQQQRVQDPGSREEQRDAQRPQEERQRHQEEQASATSPRQGSRASQQQADREQRQELDQSERAPRARQERQEPRMRFRDGVATWRIGTLGPNERRTLEARGIAYDEGPIEACLTLEFQRAFCSTMEAVAPELRLTAELLDDRQDFLICEEIGLRYAVRNAGTGPSPAVRLEQELPEGLRTAEGRRQIAVDLGEVPPGETREQVVRLLPERPGRFETPRELRAGDQQVSARPVAFEVHEPRIELALDGPAQEYMGRTLQYELEVRNAGEVPAMRTLVHIQEPPEARQLSISPQRFGAQAGVIEVGDLRPGESRRISVRFDVQEPGELRMRAAAVAYCAEPVQQEIQTRVQGVAALLLEVVDLHDPVAVGDRTVYRVRVQNQGHSPARGVELRAELPEGLEFVDSRGETRIRARGNQLEFEPVRAIPPGESVGWEIQVLASQPGPSRFSVHMRSQEEIDPVTSQEPTTVIPARGQNGQQGSEEGERRSQRRD